MGVGHAIRIIREHYKMDQRTFSYTVGISQTSLCLLETGKTIPKDATIEQIAVAFNTDAALIKLAGVGLQLANKKSFNRAFPNFNEIVFSMIFKEANNVF
ncbi:helix-turn-helix domain-containing protein [Chitinophaga sp. 22536]|uniref:helix-turn-helix domain-containing protein n=1 Tax=unclassified Chitinophaga TaxID=2619133 RepID=UPI003F864046